MLGLIALSQHCNSTLLQAACGGHAAIIAMMPVCAWALHCSCKDTKNEFTAKDKVKELIALLQSV